MEKEYKYQATIDQRPLSKTDKANRVVLKFAKQAATAGVMYEDKMFKLIVKDKPASMTQKAWDSMLNKVLRVEVIDKMKDIW